MATLPAYVNILQVGYAEQRESALLRTDMETGPPRQAKIKARVMVTRPVSLQFDTQADYASFLTWFESTINYGADWFDMTDPRTGSTVSARFAGGGLTGTPLTRAAGAWRVTASIETWG